ncbi:biotin--[acetyl-CoA-carboxylase] ligase [Luteimonas sp. RIT-PG2_3]
MSADRRLLLRLIDGPVSGDALARELGLTRAAVWKRIEALREAGVGIQARPGLGYALAHPVELLDPASILAQVPGPARDHIAALDVAWSLDSTNSQLLSSPVPAEGCQVLFAERQTGGRGRRGRKWQSPLAGSLAMSVLRGFEGGLARLSGLSLVAGVATVDALHGLGLLQARLKWPNDIVVRDGGVLHKLGGILVEGGGEHAGPVRGVIGIGLNLRLPAADSAQIDQPWTELAMLEGGPRLSRNTLAAALLARLLPALQVFDREGIAPFVARYADADALDAQPVNVHAGDGVHQGIAQGIAADGALRVLIDGVERRFHAGEVSLRARATTAETT